MLGCICPECSKAYIDPNKCNDLKRQLRRTDIGHKEKHKIIFNLCKNLVKRCGDYN